MSMGWVLFLVFIIIVVLWRLFRRRMPIPELRSLKPIYVDSDGAETFRSEKYYIAGKPDFLYQLPNNEIAIVEYKNRNSDAVYQSDRVQLIAATIAVRSQHPDVSVGYVYTASGYYERIDLRKSTEELNKSISRELSDARLAKRRIEPRALSSQAKCRGCGVRNDCAWRFE